jgi:hypothetical protein
MYEVKHLLTVLLWLCNNCAAVPLCAAGGLAEMYEVKHLLGSGSAGDTWLCR